ncbi:MAG: hypothetical protein AUG91_08695 [Actinobacteria bacterium 13_1_20CM_4_69_9]|nr:MAG: hypothetical protein AUG91_08695 [Actinobacteria bacterium 13_1_20CM_4_69_9]
MPFAICAAVVPLPYRFDASGCAAVWAVAAVAVLDVHVALEPVPPPVLHDVLCLPLAVELVGLTPDCVASAFASAPPLPPACVDALCVETLASAAAEASFFFT